MRGVSPWRGRSMNGDRDIERSMIGRSNHRGIHDQEFTSMLDHHHPHHLHHSLTSGTWLLSWFVDLHFPSPPLPHIATFLITSSGGTLPPFNTLAPVSTAAPQLLLGGSAHESRRQSAVTI
eukprot:845229-Rhodomonas_salina.3